MRALPSGTVTFLFTDIEGSTRLLHELGAEGYAAALAEHRRLLREAFAAHGGVEVDTQGDAFFVAFPTAPGAMAAAGAAQGALEGGPIRVRMGLHTGTPLVTEEGYVGEDVHRGARIAAVAHGGQVVVSAATAALAPDAALTDLGEHRLKDLSAPQRLHQLGDGDFPALRSLHRTNLPVPATPFVGRERELAEVLGLLGEARLLTLTGPGGIGKTRLALQAAAETADRYPHGVWWVPLAPLGDPVDVLPAVERAMGLPPPLHESLGDRAALLVLDNLEHVVEAAAGLAALLERCPRATLLVTSRERLRVAAERVYPVPALEREGARALFADRARAARPGFEPDAVTDELCARLDDLPLALELAAARLSALSPVQVLERLGRRLDLLRGGRDADPRQATLRATIEWSYGLLDAEERRLFAALSVFRGGFTLDAVEAVCDGEVETLESLVDKSLVRPWDGGRFGMLETIRQFAAERAAEDGLADALGERLLAHLTALADAAGLTHDGAGDSRYDRAEPERANIEAALAWARDHGHAGRGIELMRLLEELWVHGDPPACLRWIDELAAAAGDSLDPRLAAHAWRIRGGAHDMSGRAAEAEASYGRAIEAFTALGDTAQTAHLHLRLANDALARGDVDRAERLLDSLEEHARTGGGRDLAVWLLERARVARARGRRDEAMALLREAAAAASAIGFRWWVAHALWELSALLSESDPAAAEGAFAEAVSELLLTGDRVNRGYALTHGARLASALGRAERAGLLWGAFERALENDPLPGWAQEEAPTRDAIASVAGDAFDRGRARGRTLEPDDALRAALALPEPPPGARP